MTYSFSERRQLGVVSDPAPYLLHRHEAAVLDPRSAVLLPGQPRLDSTVYHRNRLLATGWAARPELMDALREAAYRHGAELEVDQRDQRLLDRAGDLGGDPGRSLMERISLRALLRPPHDRAYRPPDAWEVLQSFRELVGMDSPLVPSVGLDHLMTATSAYGDISGVSSPPTGEFGVTGVGICTPVCWFGAPPDDDLHAGSRRPVVAMLDTGVGHHPWLPEQVVERLDWPWQLIPGGAQPGAAPSDPFDQIAGFDEAHGTFAAGLVRQVCPVARLLSVRLMRGDGAVSESDLAEALAYLLLRQHRALQTGSAEAVDVVLLMCGYYHEWPGEPDAGAALAQLLDGLAELGTSVVIGAGNDATTRPMFPACLGERWEAPDRAPLVAVSALNPDGTTAALFSNDGPWVSKRRRGVASVSLMPQTYTILAPAAESALAVGDIRSALDPDDFTGGFASWSGTSFAAALVAAELAAALFDQGLDEVTPAAAVDRARRAAERLPSS